MSNVCEAMLPNGYTASLNVNVRVGHQSDTLVTYWIHRYTSSLLANTSAEAIRAPSTKGEEMDIIDGLVGEHAVLLSLIDQIEQLSLHTPNLDELKRAVSLLSVPLRQHADIEDNVLFPAVDTQLELAISCHQEHREIHAINTQFRRCTLLDEGRALLLEALARERKHFLREETELFPLIRKVLMKEQLDSLGRIWAQKRKIQLTALSDDKGTLAAF
ncbi:MAG: hemerythrin domain-containing protein [Planctomycetota bacterium]|jgi:hemerythrin-like domain-containing protein|nr:hemerythrin domain-containing protein [Planctomycetota bacterium]